MFTAKCPKCGTEVLVIEKSDDIDVEEKIVKMFRDLSPEEEEEFRQWARDNFSPEKEISECWHPVVVDEWKKLLQKEE